MIPPGLEVTVPPPSKPILVTVRVNTCRLKIAVTVVAAFIVTVQGPVPEHPPLHPTNVHPGKGVAVRVTTVPLSYDAEQVTPQLIPPGLDVTVPRPVPLLFTVSGNVCLVKIAVTVVAAFIVTEHEPVPEQPPLHPANTDPAAGVAVKVTTVLLLSVVHSTEFR